MNKPNLRTAMDTHLSGLYVTEDMRMRIVLQWKGEKVMKRKMAMGLTLAMVLLLATVGAAIALTNSDLLGNLFGRQQAPKEVEEIVSKPEETILSPNINITLDEYMYDGEKLWLHWSLANVTDKQVMVTMSPFTIDHKQMNYELQTMTQTFDYACGQLLGGEAGGVKMPTSMDCFGTYINPTPEDSPNLYHTFTMGETFTITSNLYVWELLSPPDLAITDEMNTYSEGFMESKALQGMPTDKHGVCGLQWLMRNDRSLNIYDPKTNQQTYEKRCWAKMLYKQPVEFTITLDSTPLKQTKPTETIFQTNDFSLNIRRMAYMSTGGTLVLRVTPKIQSALAKKLMEMAYEFVVLDADSKKPVNSHTPFTYGYDTYIDYMISLAPVSGEMPKAILIIPAEMNPNWNHDYSNIYSVTSSPGNNNSFYTLLMKDAVRVELK